MLVLRPQSPSATETVGPVLLRLLVPPWCQYKVACHFLYLLLTETDPHLATVSAPDCVITQTEAIREYTLQIAEKQVHYSAADIPDPPALSFTQDLARLDRQWDDRSPQWDNTSPLCILNHPIALIYWPKVYQYRGNKQWTGVKQRWFEWKVRTSYDTKSFVRSHSFSRRP